MEYDVNDVDLGEMNEAEIEAELERERRMVEGEGAFGAASGGPGGGHVEDLEDIMGGMSSKLKGLGVHGKKALGKNGKKRRVEIEYEDEEDGLGRRQRALA